MSRIDFVLIRDDYDRCLSCRPKDIVIAVMGVTGVGKSTFISYFSKTAKVGMGLESCRFGFSAKKILSSNHKKDKTLTFVRHG